LDSVVFGCSVVLCTDHFDDDGFVGLDTRRYSVSFSDDIDMVLLQSVQRILSIEHSKFGFITTLLTSIWLHSELLGVVAEHVPSVNRNPDAVMPQEFAVDVQGVFVHSDPSVGESAEHVPSHDSVPVFVQPDEFETEQD